MQLALMAFVAIMTLELLAWSSQRIYGARWFMSLLVAALSIGSAWLVIAHFAWWTVLLVFFTLYRGINLFRIISEHGRANSFAPAAYSRSSCWLIGFQSILLLAAGISHALNLHAANWLAAFAAVQIIVASILLRVTLRNLRTTRPAPLADHYASQNLPTLTVAIPARNETDDLEACLTSLARSDYPKLEILVLDDCSQNKRTPEIIRAFAQEGVRFIAGQVPPVHWLAKNYAYQQLADEANGELLLFCGVDTRFQPTTLRHMVELLLDKQKSMLSIIPRNQLVTSWRLLPLLIQPSRYAWELSLPRRWFKRPPVLSTCWLIATKQLETAGGFRAVSRSISPESYFARHAIRTNDGYSFLQADQDIGVSSAKSPAEQAATAVRTRYPQLHRRPEIAALVTLAELFVLVWPFIQLVLALVVGMQELAIISAAVCIMLVAQYSQVVRLTYRNFLWRGLYLLPFAAIYDAILLNYSMYKYEFDEVIWKDRNVCIPVMHVSQQQPSLVRLQKGL